MKEKLLLLKDFVKQVFSYLEDKEVLDKTNQVDIYERIVNNLGNIKEIENEEIRQMLTFKLEKVAHIFEEARIKFDQISPGEEYLFLQEKNKIANYILQELDDIEKKLNLKNYKKSN
ncbi:MAG: hypothetical protein IKN63_03965 [Bacilli bacterium]|nr:hypothetical protein [Bacilli bacterium]